MRSPHSEVLVNLARIGKLKTEATDAGKSSGLLRTTIMRLHEASETPE